MSFACVLAGLLAAADVYSLNDLRSHCEQFAREVLSLSTVLPLLMASEKYAQVKNVQKVQYEVRVFVSFSTG